MVIVFSTQTMLQTYAPEVRCQCGRLTQDQLRGRELWAPQERVDVWGGGAQLDCITKVCQLHHWLGGGVLHQHVLRLQGWGQVFYPPLFC